MHQRTGMISLLRNASPRRTVLAAATLILGFATPAFAKERVDRYLVPDAAGGAPIQLSTVGDWYKEQKVRSAVIKSGVPIPKGEKAPGASYLSTLKADAVYVQGIVDAKEKEVLPRAYTLAVPISTRTALVRRKDDQYGFVDLKTRVFRPLPPNTNFTAYPFGIRHPLRLVMGNLQPDGTYSHCVVDPMGGCDKKITQVDGRASGQDFQSSVFAFPDKLIVRHRSGKRTWSASYRWDQTIIASPLPPIMPVQRFDQEKGKIRFNSVLFELPMPERRFGTVNTKLYWPMDEAGEPADMPDDFVGMFPFQPVRWETEHIGAWEGYVVIRMINGQEQFFIGDRVKVGTDEHYAPDMLAVFSRLLAGPFADVWINGGGESGDIADVSAIQTLALRKAGTSGAPQWVSAERLDPTVPLMKRLAEAQASALTTTDPALATRIQFDADARRRDAAFAAFKAESAKRDKALADLRAIPRTFTAAPGSCYPFYDYAKTTALGMEPGIFVRAYDTNPTEACRFVPESLYVSMERAELVRSGGTADEPPKKTFAQQVDEWNKELERQADARDLERATTGRTCVKVVHVLYC